MTNDQTITIDTVINDAVLQHPEILPVLEQNGLDACCGGHLTIAEAAARHALPATELVQQLQDAITAPSCCMR